MAAGSSSSSCSLLLLLLVVAAALLSPYPANAGSCSLTAGFSRVNLNESQFVVQKPYDVPLNERYEFVDGVRRMWVFASDKPISSTHPGGARTEIKVDKLYSSGVWQFEGDMFVPSRTSGASVMQIFGAAPPHASTVMLPVYVDSDAARLRRCPTFHWRRLVAPGQGGTEHYFKFGVYKQSHHNPSYRMESHYWKNVAVYTKP